MSTSQAAQRRYRFPMLASVQQWEAPPPLSQVSSKNVGVLFCRWVNQRLRYLYQDPQKDWTRKQQLPPSACFTHTLMCASVCLTFGVKEWHEHFLCQCSALFYLMTW